MIGPAFAETLAAARDGEEQAFAVLWRDLNPALLRYLRVLAPAMADDVAAEVWLEVCRDLRRFRGDEAGFRSWLFTVARMRAVDAARKAARRPVQPIAPGSLPDRPAADDPAEAALEAEATRDALGLIAELPPDQAEVVALRVIAGLDVAQVGEIVGKRPGTVRVLAHRGLRRLAQRLAERTGV
ncbi:MAG TPA: RNA polymerase sigma factor [Mycobacteriales bacterium]|jgi:RNA polymerase sigma-70 factor (ECF subfamily)|nr:RNA polymerase sigma factor [Mycobacteriales bacterium]